MAFKIDAHQHFWHYTPSEYPWINDSMVILKRDFLPEDLQPLLIRQGFDGSLAIQARQSLEETTWLLQLADQDNFIKGVVGWLDLCSPDLEKQLDQYAGHPKLVGVRHVLQDEPDGRFVLREDFQEGIGKLANYKLVYDILITSKQLPQTIQFVRNFPGQAFVLDHIAKPGINAREIHPWKQNIEKLADRGNVYCKISGMVTEAGWYNWKPADFKPYLDIVVNAFGTKRLMIGSDWPVCTLAGTYHDVISLAGDYFSHFSLHEQEMLFGTNALKTYSLPF
jgi:L-fuconolactonase